MMRSIDSNAPQGAVRFRPTRLLQALGLAALCSFATGFSSPVWAQAAASPAAAASAPNDQARRLAESPMKWILVNANKSRRQPAADAAAPAAAPAAAVAAPRPVAAPASVQVAVAPSSQASPTPRVAPATSDGGIRTTVSPLPAAGASPAPAPVVTAAPVVAASVAPVVAPQPSSQAAPAPTAAPSSASPAAVPAPVAAAPAPVDDDDEEDVIPVKQVEPQPSAAVMRNYPKGTVKVRFDVLPNGNTGNIQVLSSTQRQLNASVTSAVKEWTFKPVKKTQTVEVEFAMNFE